MKVLVTGGAGFIGSHLTDLLLSHEYETVVVDNFSTGSESFLPPHVKVYQLDICSPELKTVFAREQPDIVFHLAAQVDVATSIQTPSIDAAINISGTLNVLENCQKYGVKKIIYSSSSAVYGETGDCSISEDFPVTPLSFYGISKSVPEIYMRLFHELYGLNYTILRYANVYGPRQSECGEGGVISIFCKKLCNGEIPVIFGNGEQSRDFVFVKDVARANLAAIHFGNNEIINIGCDKKTSISSLFDILTNKLKLNVRPIYKPSREGDILHSRLDISKARRLLNWQPLFDLETGLNEVVSYYSHVK